MKNLFLLPLMLLFSSISAQNVMKTTSDSILYLTAEQEAFMIDKETKYLFKSSPLQYEQKLNEAFSINLTIAPELYYTRIVSVDTDETYLSNIFLNSEAEVRYYYKLPRLIKEGKQANNLSSSYFALGASYGKTLWNSDRNIVDVDRNTYKIFAAWGDQKRFLNYGYLDYGIELGYLKSSQNSILGGSSNVYRSISLSSRTKVGFALGKKYDINEETKCPIFKCYLDRKSALKINYNRLYSITLGSFTNEGGLNSFFAFLNPNISYEFKLGNTAFSINQDMDFTVSFSNSKGFNQDQFGISAYGLDYDLGARYYFNLKSNIKKGKSGNNLSGLYLYALGNYSLFSSESVFIDFMGNPIISKYNAQYLNASAGIGYQKTVLNDLYFDLSLGFNARIYTIEDSSLYTAPNLLDVEIKVGKML